MRWRTGLSIDQIMACRMFGAKPPSELMLKYCQLGLEGNITVKFYSKFKTFHASENVVCKMVAILSPPQITNLTIVNSTVYSGADQRKYQSSASLAFVRGNHRRPVNSTHKGPVTRKMFPFDDVIMPSASEVTMKVTCKFTFNKPQQSFTKCEP